MQWPVVVRERTGDRCQARRDTGGHYACGAEGLFFFVLFPADAGILYACYALTRTVEKA